MGIYKMAGSHVVLIDPSLDLEIRRASQQIAGLCFILIGSKQYLQAKLFADDFTGGVILYQPKSQRSYLEPAPIAKEVMVHIRVDPAYATIIGIWLPERGQGWGIPPRGAPEIVVKK